MGTTTIYRMFSDYTASSPFAHLKRERLSYAQMASLLSCSHCKSLESKCTRNMWLAKDISSVHFTLPSNYKRLKERLAVMDDVATALPNISADDKEKIREVWLEATVSTVVLVSKMQSLLAESLTQVLSTSANRMFLPWSGKLRMLLPVIKQHCLSQTLSRQYAFQSNLACLWLAR